MSPNRGFIHWVDLDKRRPAVVLSVDELNAFAHHVVVVPVFSKGRPLRTHVPLNKGEGGLRSDSVSRCEQVMTVPKSMILPEPLGPGLSEARMQQIVEALLHVIQPRGPH
ncbi:MAG: type II toxin-antitoxin system PemK/MazF family toxin [Myxococcota bacterium]